MNLPVFTSLPLEIANRLPVWNHAVAQAQDVEGPVTFSCPILTSADGKTLLLGLEQERTAAGRALVRALWFDHPITLWLPGENGWLNVTARAWKCHITGPVFRTLMEQVRKRNPRGDLAVVWEIYPVAQSPCGHPPKTDACPLLREAEIHLELLPPESPNL